MDIVKCFCSSGIVKSFPLDDDTAGWDAIVLCYEPEICSTKLQKNQIGIEENLRNLNFGEA